MPLPKLSEVSDRPYVVERRQPRSVFFLIPAAVHHPLTCVCTVGHGRGVKFDPRTRGVPAGPTARQTRTVPVGTQRNPAFWRARRVLDIPVGLQRRPEQHSQQVEQPKGHGQGKCKCPPDELVKYHEPRRQGDRSEV